MDLFDRAKHLLGSANVGEPLGKPRAVGSNLDPLPTSTDRLGIRRVERLGASLCQGKELRRKPYHPVGMGLLYLTQIAATNFIRASIPRHFKDAPPLAFFGLLRRPPT